MKNKIQTPKSEAIETYSNYQQLVNNTLGSTQPIKRQQMTVVIEEKKEVEHVSGDEKSKSNLGTLDLPTPITTKPTTAFDGLDSSKQPPNTTQSYILRATIDADSKFNSPGQSQET